MRPCPIKTSRSRTHGSGSFLIFLIPLRAEAAGFRNMGLLRTPFSGACVETGRQVPVLIFLSGRQKNSRIGIEEFLFVWYDINL